jgi:hypothetical protein
MLKFFSSILRDKTNRMVPRQVEELCSNATHLAHSANQICIVGPRALGVTSPDYHQLTKSEQRRAHGMDEHHKAQAMHKLRNIPPAWCWYFPRDTLKRASGLAEPSPEVGHPRNPWIAPTRPCCSLNPSSCSHKLLMCQRASFLSLGRLTNQSASALGSSQLGLRAPLQR